MKYLSKAEATKSSPDHEKMSPYWQLVGDLVEGVDAMKRAGATYLPKFHGETDDEYSTRLSFAEMTNVYGDIVENLSSKPFEHEVMPENAPDEVLRWAEDIDGSGQNLTGFARELFADGINDAVAWVLIDAPKTDAPVVSRADQLKYGVRPFATVVLGVNMLEVRSANTPEGERFTYARIFEPGTLNRVRILETENGRVKFRLYEERPKNKAEEAYELIREDFINVPRLPITPFATGRRIGRTFQYKPALRDAAFLQRKLYRNETGLEFKKHTSAFAMLTATGVNPPKDANGKPEPVRIGPNRVLYGGFAPDGTAGSWSWIEPNAANMKFLADDNKATIEQIRELGRQPLTAQSGSHTVIAASMASSKTRSTVAQWAHNLKNSLENVFVLMCMFDKGVSYDPVVYVHTEFDNFTDGKDLETLDADRDRGDISRETLLREKQRRGVYGADWSIEEEEKRLLKEAKGFENDSAVDDPPPPVDDKNPPELDGSGEPAPE